MAQMKHRVLTVLCMGVLAAACASAAPFAKTFSFTQPDGTRIEVWGEGDEFRAVFEHRGYTVVRDRATMAYTYARLSADGTALLPTRLLVGQADPAASGLPQHLRIAPEAAAAQARLRFERWDAGMQIRRRWQERKSQLQLLRAQAAGDISVMAPPSFTTTGTKVGLCLLIDFPDAPATVPSADIHEFCNGDGYTGYGNNGSVKEYYQDVSGGLLTYTNVVTAYVRMVKPHSFYCDTSKDAGSQANILIADAIAILKAQPNYETEILPTFESLSQEGDGELVACNVFYAGDNGGDWTMGLWPHSWSLYEAGPQDLGDGKFVFKYQITDIGATLELGTFCHENGHMLCGYPDIYDYQYDSVGGAGQFCLMNSGGHGHNPVQVCAYLKYASGWTETVEVTLRDYIEASLTATVGEPGFNRIYRFAKPGVDTEYYLFENRQQAGRDAGIPGSGVAIWHIDEQGDRDDQRRDYNTEHQNYECTLMQADNLWHFQNNVNSGDARDLYYEGNPATGYINRFNDSTQPSARWWDGTSSRIKAESFSANGSLMTFVFQVDPPEIATLPTLPNGRVGRPYAYALLASGYATPFEWQVISNTLPAGLALSVGGQLSGMPEEAGTSTFLVSVTAASGKADTNEFSLTILPALTVPLVETFEEPQGPQSGWQQEFVTNRLAWTYRNGATYPTSAYRGTNSACLVSADSGPYVTRLISPRIVFAPGAQLPQLSFWHIMGKFDVRQDQLRVYYKSAYEDPWTLLAAYTSSVNLWTQRTLALPDPSESYYLCFEGTARYGYGIHIDDIVVRDAYQPLAIMTPSVLPEAQVKTPYAVSLTPQGGFGPYTFDLNAGVLPVGLTLSTNGVISGVASNLETQVFTVQLTDHGEGVSVFADFTLSVGPPRVTLFAEGFEYGGMFPQRWIQQTVSNQVSWTFLNGGGNGDTFHLPESAYEGNINAVLWVGNPSNHVTRLFTKNGINLGAAPSTPRLEFQHAMRAFQGMQDELRVWIKSDAAEPWSLLAAYTNDTPDWTLRTLALPNPSTNYFVMFEGTARFGQGVCIDDIRITDGSIAPIITTLGALPGATVGMPYSQTFQAAGGEAPYTWSVVAGTLPDGVTFSAEGLLSGTPLTGGITVFSVAVTDVLGFASTNECVLTVSNLRRVPFFENLDAGSVVPSGWSQQIMTTGSTLKWLVGIGNGASPAVPSAAHSVPNNLYLRSGTTSPQRTRLLTPALDLGSGMTNATLSFWLCMASKNANVDELQVFYKTNALVTEYKHLLTIKTAVPAWSNVVVALPEASDSYVIAFDGIAKAGHGVCMDDISVTGDYPATGGYADWQIAEFGAEITDEAIVGMTADPDGDGVENWLEYAMALDPMAQDSEFAMDGGVTAGYLTLSYRKNPLATDVTFTVEACDDLAVQDWTTVDVSETGIEDYISWLWITNRHDVPVADAPRRFLRLTITPPAP